MHQIRAAIVFVLASLACAQQLPQFEVASIKPSPPGATEFHVDVGVHIDGAQVKCNYLSLKDYIRMAYNVKEYQVTGPEWIATDRFDIVAKLPDDAKRDQLRDMIKALLADRFHLKLHKESKEFPVYGLVVAKGGLKMKESKEDPESTPPAPGSANVTASGGPEGVNISLGNGSFFGFANNRIEAKKLDMPRFAETIARFEDRPVVDMTGLTGSYDFTIDMTTEDYNAMRIRSAISAGVVLPPQAMRLLELSSGDSLASGLQALGLKMESRKAPLDVFVVDQADKTPTAN
jgi:uncharacterized protein (TIGR03435 family)